MQSHGSAEIPYGRATSYVEQSIWCAQEQGIKVYGCMAQVAGVWHRLMEFRHNYDTAHGSAQLFSQVGLMDLRITHHLRRPGA